MEIPQIEGRNCIVVNCSRKIRAKSLCSKHYYKQYDSRRTGTPERRAQQRSRYARNPSRQRNNVIRWRIKNADIIRSRLVGRRYGKAERWFLQKIAEQNNLCGLCGKPFGTGSLKPCADHDHITGESRDILHLNCNAAIGFLGDDPNRCRQAAMYLEKYK